MLPLRKKPLRFNSSPFMSKALRKAIVHRSKLKNKIRTDVNWANYKKQRNFCVTLLRRTKKDYFQNLSAKSLPENKKIPKTIKPTLVIKDSVQINCYVRTRENLKEDQGSPLVTLEDIL